MGSEELPPWGKIQKRTFTRWCNVHLLERKIKIDDLESDFSDGFRLLNLLEVISGKKIQYTKNVKFYSQKLENVGKALKFIRDQGIKLVAIGPEDIVEKRIKLILGLIWTIILRYQINKVEYVTDAPGSPRGVKNQDLLQWVNATVPQFHVKNFKGDWKDGKVLYALVAAVKPGAVDANISVNLAPVDRASKAIEAAKVKLNIPDLIDAHDIVSDHSDDLSVMTYVSYFRAYDVKAKTPDPANTQISGPGSKKAKVGSENIFNVITKNCFGDNVNVGGHDVVVKVSPQNDPSFVVPVTVKDNDNGQYEVNYSPQSAGPHVVEVTLDGVPLGKSPFVVEAKDVPLVDPKTSIISKPIYVGEDGLTHFEVTTRDKNGNNVVDLSVPVVAAVKDVNDGSDAHVTVTPKEDGVYDVTIAPTKSGDYEVKVGLRDTNIPKNIFGGKPFIVKLEPPVEKPKPISKDDIDVDLKDIGTPNEDGIVRFTLKPKNNSDIKKAKFNVEIAGPQGKTVPTEITANPDGTFTVSLNPTDTGDHQIKIDFSDPSGEISELPLVNTHIQVKPVEEEIPAYLVEAAEKTKIDLDGLRNGLDPLGKLHFAINNDDLPEGVKVVPKLIFVSKGEDEIPLTVGDPTPVGVDVAFSPPASGDYKLEVELQKDGKVVKVPNMPVTFGVVLPEHKPAEASVQKAAEDTIVDFSGLSAEPTEDGGVSFNVDCGKKLPEGANLSSKILFVPDGSVVPHTIVKDGDEGKFKVIFYPKHTEGPAQYVVALSIKDKNDNEAKVKGGPYKVNVIIVRNSEFPNVNPRVAKVAKEAAIDMKPLNSGPNKEGKMHFDIIRLPETLPKGSKIESKITNTADGSDIPVEIVHDGDKYGVFFKPAGSGVYMIEALLADEEDNGANITGAPVRLTLNLGTAPPRSANAPDALVEKAAEASKIDLSGIGKGPNKDGDLEFAIETPDLPEGSHLESTIVFVPDNKDLPCHITPSPSEKGKNTVAFKPVRTGEYMIASNIVDKDGKSARVKGTPVRLQLTLPEQPAGQAIQSTPNAQVREAAEKAKVDLNPIGEGVNKSGQVHFTIDAPDIPADAVLAPKVAFNNQDLPVVVRPVEGSDGKYSVEFPPSGSGEYLISASILDKDGLPAKVKGTPIRLNLRLPETASQSSRPSTPNIHSSQSSLSPPPSTLSPLSPSASAAGAASSTLSPLSPAAVSAGNNTNIIRPSPLSLSHVPSSGAPSTHDPHSAAQHPAVEEDPITDAEHTLIHHSFQIEAKTKSGLPRIRGGDVFSVSISGPQGPVEGVQIADLGNGKYQVSYDLPSHGKYTIRATLNNRDVVGSPFIQKI